MEKLLDLTKEQIELMKKGPEGVVDFYKQIGWESEQFQLDPKNVLMNRKVADGIVEDMIKDIESRDERISISFMWLNYGPSSRDDIPEDKILLKDGWLVAG